MTTTESVRLRLGDLVRDSCSHVTCAYHGRVGVLMRDTGLMWPVDFGDGIEWYPSTGSRRGPVLIPVPDEAAYTYLVARNANNEGIYLVWHGAGSNTDLTKEVYEAITEEADAASLAPTYHVYSRRNLIVTDDVVWYQIPDRILSDFVTIPPYMRGPERAS